MCIGYILVLALRQANASWWLILSLSGHSVVIVFLFISVYLFAIFRGVTTVAESVEHPLTGTDIYMVFYNITPFLGALAGFLGTVGLENRHPGQHLLSVALGTLAATFVVWVLVDPVIGLVELLYPASRSHRLARLEAAKQLRQHQKDSNDKLLADLLAAEELKLRNQREALMPKIERLSELIVSGKIDFETECQAMEIGTGAWIMGGLNCMKHLHESAIEMCRRKQIDAPICDYLSVWWDGIGDWRNKSLV